MVLVRSFRSLWIVVSLEVNKYTIIIIIILNLCITYIL